MDVYKKNIYAIGSIYYRLSKMTAWLPGKVVENKQWCANLFSLKIRTSPLAFSAGQFVKVGLDIDDKILARPYSLVNTPEDSLLEIHFNCVAKGLLSPRLAKLSVGDNIKISERATGLLTLDEVPDVPHLWLIATGTGVGPFISILKTSVPWQRFKKIILGYSVKTAENQAYMKDFADLHLQHPEQFSFIPFTTREKTSETVNTRITTSIKKGELEKHVGIRLAADSSHIMLCGNSTMVGDVTALLEERGLRRHTRREPGQIATEKYY